MMFRRCGFPMIALLLAVSPVHAQAGDPRAYDVGTPVVTDLYVSPAGSDSNDGAAREGPLQTLGAAWARIPEGELSGTGYRINLLPGEYPCQGDCINFFADRAGTAEFPIIVQAADGPGTVTLLGGLNLANVRYLYIFDLSLRAGGGAPLWGNNVLHCERCDHLLLRGATLAGPVPAPDNYEIQEVVKVNQSQYVYVEDSDIGGTYQTGVDFVAVQYGHFLNNRVHDAGEWCMVVKGGSAYLRVEANLFYGCGLGFQAGEGTNFEIMQPPWLHYEAYDVRFVNNILRDIPGTGLSVAGGYNILLAYNTLYNVATFDDGSGRGYSLARVGRGERVCADTSENGQGNAQQICGEHLAQGGWGAAALGDDNGGDWIPNRNVFIYNNVFYNPAPARTRYSHFEIAAPLDLPPQAQNIPNPAAVDDNLQIRGNLIWNGPPDMPLGVEDAAVSGCQPSNPTCNADQLRADNTINTVEPELVDPASGDLHPVQGGNVFGAASCLIPKFTWDDAPPGVPVGDLDNVIDYDYEGVMRLCPGLVGAFDTSGS